MKILVYILLVCLLAHKNSFSQFQYISPLPGSRFHNPDCTIILREGNYIDPASIKDNDLFSLYGLKSGEHELVSTISEDEKTIILKPLVAFAEGETVMVTVKDGIRKQNGDAISGCSFSFEIRPRRTDVQSLNIESAKRRIYEEEFGPLSGTGSDTREDNGLPKFSIDINTSPAPGMLFYHNWRLEPIHPGNMYICIMSSEGDSIYSLKTSNKGLSFDLNRNGYLTVYNHDSFYFEMWDSSYNLIDIYKAGNGYIANNHEFLVFPDKHSFILIYDPQIVDMTVYHPAFKPDATVIGAIIQELDSKKNVVFEWRSWDHLEITEALHADLSSSYIDYVHANAIELDTDGNLLVSCRIMDQILKIDRNSGDIIWRLGGLKNEFTFVNDPYRFNHQHDIRRLPNGHITLFDNGSYHVPPQTFVKEYKLDEMNKTATLVWSYSYPYSSIPLVCWAMGNAQRLPNGNTLINWGEPSYLGPSPNITEVDSAGTIVWDMHFTDSVKYVIYRAHRYEWDPCARPTGNLMHTTDVMSTSVKVHWPHATGAWEYLISFRRTGNESWDSVIVSGDVNSYSLFNLSPATSYDWRIQTICDETGKSSGYSSLQNFTTLPTSLITVYPNPARDQLNIHVKMDQSVKLGVQLFNVLGQLTYQKQFSSIDEEITFTIPLHSFPAGMYFLQMDANNHHQLQKILIE